MTATIGTSMLGLTIGCARCHDHKYDPIPQTDYYRLLSTFTTTVRTEMDVDLHPDRVREAKAQFDAQHTPLVLALATFEKEQLPGRFQQWFDANARSLDPRQLVLTTEAANLAALAAVARPSRGFIPLASTAQFMALPAERRMAALSSWFASTDADWRKLSAAVAESLKHAPKPKLTKVLVCSEGLPAIRLHTQGADFLDKTHILKRGDPNQKQEVATQSFLQALMTAPDKEQHWKTPPPEGWRTSYRRRSLAAWITDVDQGAGRLLARVIVNRLWQHHFGRGIVATPSDFGAQGERPTHPELLDWLAGELVREGWRLKPLHRQMMLSAAYVQGNTSEPSAVAADPENRLFGRRTHQRLEAEAIRDSMLAVSGALDASMFGPGTLDRGLRRRSIYFTVKRSQLIPLMTLFDGPDSLQSLGSRGATTVAPQALAMMNNAQVQEYARSTARRLLADTASGEAAAIDRGYLLALGRSPGTEEVADALEFLKTQRASYIAAGKSATAGKDSAAEVALADFCQALFCLNEFMYVE